MPKTIIITGASRGIGQAIARYLLQQGNNVVILARSEKPLQELQAQHPAQVRVLAGDMANFDLAAKAVELTNKEFGRIDGLIINHGVLAPVTQVVDSNPEHWKQNFDVNFFSAVAFARAAIPELRKSNGCIIFTSSGAATHSYSTWGAYGASKAALNHLGMTIGVEEPNITTLSIGPGVVDTEMQRELRDVHSTLMTEKDAARFHILHKEGGLLRPEQPGHVMARVVLNPPKDLSGHFLRWDSVDLAAYQDQKVSE
ncbi:hypothetical protein MMC26_000698 [Xylographa opegraphella]|nr:hypothetical protein [Xylographa opegraphella]